MTEEDKEFIKSCLGDKYKKYSKFVNKVSKILKLHKVGDILMLYSITDEYFKPIEKHIKELEEWQKEQWHDLCENPDDYPDDFRLVLCGNKAGTMFTAHCKADNSWEILVGADYSHPTIVLNDYREVKWNVHYWCELPQPKRS